jgi:FRG domain
MKVVSNITTTQLRDVIMSIAEVHTKTLAEALTHLEDLASNDYVGFRGHSNVEWRLCSTLSRFTTIARENWDILPDLLLSHFMSALASVGQLPQANMDRRGRLEYGRHYGVPSPLIDFTFSPYVALFFAFNGVRPDANNKDAEVVIYTLNFQALAQAWALSCDSLDIQHSAKHYDAFLHEKNPLFPNGYPAHTLKLILFPASWNRRMQRQMGMFLYDTLNYLMMRKADLEEFIKDIKEPAESNGANAPKTLTKVFIPKSIARDVFTRLDLMGMTGARLLDDHEGAAADVYNSYNYNRKSGYNWDLVMDPPDDTKM